MGTGKINQSVILAFILILFFALTSCAKNGRINDIMVMDDMTDVLVYARLQDLRKGETEKLIYAGVPVNCTFYVNFYQASPYLFDRRLSRLVVRNAIKYDNVKKSIYVTTRLNEKEKEISEFKDVGAAEAYLLEISGISVIKVHELVKGGKYYVTIKAKVEKDQHSRFVRYILFFLPFMETETNWYRKEFIWKG